MFAHKLPSGLRPGGGFGRRQAGGDPTAVYRRHRLASLPDHGPALRRRKCSQPHKLLGVRLPMSLDRCFNDFPLFAVSWAGFVLF